MQGNDDEGNDDEVLSESEECFVCLSTWDAVAVVSMRILSKDPTVVAT